MGNQNSNENLVSLRVLEVYADSPCKSLFPFLDFIVDVHNLDFETHQFSIEYFSQIVEESKGSDILLSVYSLEKRRVRTIRVSPKLLLGKFSLGIKVRAESYVKAEGLIFNVKRVFENSVGKSLGLKAEEDWVLGFLEEPINSFEHFCNKIGVSTLTVAVYNEKIRKTRFLDFPKCEYFGVEFASGSSNTFHPVSDSSFLFQEHCDAFENDKIIDLNSFDNDFSEENENKNELLQEQSGVSLLTLLNPQNDQLNTSSEILHNQKEKQNSSFNITPLKSQKQKTTESNCNEFLIHFEGKLKFDFGNSSKIKTMADLECEENFTIENFGMQETRVGFSQKSFHEYESGMSFLSILDEMNNSLTQGKSEPKTIFCKKTQNNYEIHVSDLFSV